MSRADGFRWTAAVAVLVLASEPAARACAAQQMATAGSIAGASVAGNAADDLAWRRAQALSAVGFDRRRATARGLFVTAGDLRAAGATSLLAALAERSGAVPGAAGGELRGAVLLSRQGIPYEIKLNGWPVPANGLRPWLPGDDAVFAWGLPMDATRSDRGPGAYWYPQASGYLAPRIERDLLQSDGTIPWGLGGPSAGAGVARGRPLPAIPGIDELVRLDAVHAVELYERAEDVPPELAWRRAARGPLLVIWAGAE